MKSYIQTYRRKKNWWFVTVSFGIRETAKLKSISTHFSLLVSETTPVSETFLFFQIRGWSKGCYFLHLLREVQARCFISWQLYLLTQFSQCCTLKIAYDSKTSPCPSHYEQVKEAWSSLVATTARENNGTLVRLPTHWNDRAAWAWKTHAADNSIFASFQHEAANAGFWPTPTFCKVSIWEQRHTSHIGVIHDRHILRTSHLGIV